MEFWANDGPASRDIKERHFRGRGKNHKKMERRTYKERKIDGDGFQDITKMVSSVVLSLIQFMLKIFQSVMNITMN